MSQKKPSRSGENAPLYITGITPEERARLEAFAEAVGRPLGWVVRDAITCYLDSLEPDVEALAAKMEAVKIDLKSAGKTTTPPRGRPKKKP